MTLRTHAPIDLNLQTLGQTVQLAGWVQRRRDHGGVIFIDLRDRENIVQLVFNPAQADMFAKAERLRAEYVISVQGIVNARPDGTRNANLPTGDIEILVTELTVLNRAEPLPFQLDDTNTSEETRLRYRYLDLRRAPMQRNLRLRAQVTRAVRNYLDDHGFLDIETPILTRATPEGARDYLVPSRTHEHSFFALPQSPQLFKQLLMVSGFDRYYQIARCFRDEDLRADRQPEFTQIDIETSFLSQEEIIELAEGMAQHLFKTVLNIDLGKFPRMTWETAMRDYGSDKPDLRNPLKLVDVADLVKDVDFKVFSAPARDPNCRVTALRVPNGGSLTRKQIDDYTAFVAQYKARGLAYIKINSLENGLDGFQSPIAKFLGEAIIREIIARTGAQAGDLIFFGADTFKIVSDALGALRLKVGRDLNLASDTWQPLWVVDFPMFEFDPEANRWVALHHPFTAPMTDDLQTLRDNPAAALSRAYDMVLNGTELGGGSVRIFQPEMQRAVFDLLGISPEEAQEKFGFLLEALQFGAPPHGGLAFGLDRLVMLMAKQSSIRDVIPFPKTQSAACLLTDAPGSVDARQLKDLHIKLREKIVK